MLPEQYIVRSPENDAEILSWGMFSGERGFGHRPGAKDRFYKRYLADPTAQPHLVRAAFLPCGRIIGSCRLFVRDILLPTNGKDALKNEDGSDLYKALSSEEHGLQVIRSFGWGEVCSDPDWRGRGVAAQVLNDVTQLMEKLCSESKAPEFSTAFGMDETSAEPVENTKPLITLLHAADNVQGLYQKYGFQSLTIPYSRLPLTSLGDAENTHPPELSSVVTLFNEEFTLRAVDLVQDIPSLMRLHKNFISTTRCYGTTHRSAEYWSRWMKNVNDGSRMWVLESKPSNMDEPPEILAYCTVQCKGGMFKIIDMAWDASALYSHAQSANAIHHDPTSPRTASSATPAFAYQYLSSLINAAALDTSHTTDYAPSLWSDEFLVPNPLASFSTEPFTNTPEPSAVSSLSSEGATTTAHAATPASRATDASSTFSSSSVLVPSVATPLVVSRLLFEPFSSTPAHSGCVPTTPCAPGAAATPFGFDRPAFVPEADPELAENGWMVRPLQHAGKVAEDIVNALHLKSQAGEFLVFGADAF